MVNRYSRFGIVINPETEKKVCWLEKNHCEIGSELKELNFVDGISLEKLLGDLTIHGKKRSGEVCLSSIEAYGGQLEQGSKGVPHWQLWIEVKPQVSKSALLKALSQKIYSKEKSLAISVQETGLDDTALRKYCLKEGRLELAGIYSYNVVNKETKDFRDYIRENPGLEIVYKSPWSYQKYLIELVREKNFGRSIKWIVDIDGASGKSSLATILRKDPSMNTIILSVDSYDRFKAQSIRSLNRYKKTRKVWPSAILIDSARDEETKHLHEIYGILEKLNDGYLTSFFGGREEILEMKIGIPIIVLANSIPTLGALSEDRWDILAIHKSYCDKEDYIIQRASVNCVIVHASNTAVVWRNQVTTKEPEMDKKSNLKSEKLLQKIYKDHLRCTRESGVDLLPRESRFQRRYVQMRHGIVDMTGEERSSPVLKAPEMVLRLYTARREREEQEKK